MFWKKANISLCDIRQTSKINMLQDGPYLNIHHITLMIVSTVISFDSSSGMLKTVECEIDIKVIESPSQRFTYILKVKPI